MAILDLGKVKLNYKGTWTNASSYEKDDVVLFNGSLWINTADASANAGKNFKAPGFRDRTTVFGPAIDKLKVKTYKVTKEILAGVGSRFFFDRVPQRVLKLVRGRKYRFYFRDNSMLGIDFQLCTSADGTTYTSGVTQYGTNGRDGWLQFEVPMDAPDTLYYKQVGTSGVGGTGSISVIDGWEGYKYWEQLSEGFKYRGDWSATTQYYHHDVVIRQGGLYIAMQDSIDRDPTTLVQNGKFTVFTPTTLNAAVLYTDTTLTVVSTANYPDSGTIKIGSEYITYTGKTSTTFTGCSRGQKIPGTGKNGEGDVYSVALGYPSGYQVHHINAESNQDFPVKRIGYWKALSVGNWARPHHQAVALMNKAPLGWPYKHTKTFDCVSYGNHQWIAADGRVWSIGSGNSGSPGYATNQPTVQAREVTLHSHSWWMSRDNWPETNVTGLDVGSDASSSAGNRNRNMPRGHGDAVTPHGERPKCVQIVHNYDSAMYLLDNGQVCTVGYGGHGQLGDGNSSNRDYVNNVRGLDEVKVIKIDRSWAYEDSTSHCGALDDEGNLYMWGYNGYGQLGTGDTNNKSIATRIPKEYFNNEKIVDFVIGGAGEASSWAWTEKGNIYAWGRNNVGQLGIGDTSDRYRPAQITAFDPSANNGIVKVQTAGNGSHNSFYVLDGNGYVWHAGYNGYYQGLSGDTTNHSTLYKSTQSPVAGNCVDFWAACPNSYARVWFRTGNGNTYFVGHQSYYGGGIAVNNSNISTPTILPNITNLKEVYSVGTYSDAIRTMWLTDDGRVWGRGYNNYGWNSNQDAGDSYTGESNGSDYRPWRMAMPAGIKPVSIMFWSNDESTNYFGPHCQILTNDGRVYFLGAAGRSNQGRQCLGGNQWGTGWNNSCRNPSLVTQGR